ncbi:DUF2793 domain-containing protein [Microbaculum marinisediminis]|uniref:DUF2793 domain-containing protein n=1 Tax=Microbaculum marinisediminis TaxID=2931392 RepID=UPI0021C1032C|nr:DUF2793 domain-containing protein [Microbaculum sp. A6E488]
MAETARLRLPEIAAAQAQKHVTHNEALVALDTLVQLSVLDKDLSAPPGSPAEGDCYIVAAGATGAWTGWEDRIARYEDGAWRSFLPGAGDGVGWLAWVRDEEAFYVLTATGWDGLAAGSGAIESGTWTPVVTFDTPGDLSVTYHERSGTYVRAGDTVFLTYTLQFTPTYTTASGSFRIDGLPFTVVADGLGTFQPGSSGGSAIPSFPASTSYVVTIMTAIAQKIALVGIGSGNLGVFSTVQIVSGTKYLFRGEPVYGA